MEYCWRSENPKLIWYQKNSMQLWHYTAPCQMTHRPNVSYKYRGSLKWRLCYYRPLYITNRQTKKNVCGKFESSRQLQWKVLARSFRYLVSAHAQLFVYWLGLPCLAGAGSWVGRGEISTIVQCPQQSIGLHRTWLDARSPSDPLQTLLSPNLI